MTPNTFEAYTYAYLGAGENAPAQVAVGYSDRMKKRNSEDFVSMFEAAVVERGDRGMP